MGFVSRALVAAALVAAGCATPGRAGAVGEPGSGTVLPPPGARAPRAPDEVDLSPAELSRLQRALVAEGFLHRPPSGSLDRETRQALRAWQTAQGFEPSGALDARSAERLLARPSGSPPARAPPTADDGAAIEP